MGALQMQVTPAGTAPVTVCVTSVDLQTLLVCRVTTAQANAQVAPTAVNAYAANLRGPELHV